MRQALIKMIRQVVPGLALFLFILPSVCFSQNIQMHNVTSFVHNPAELANWFAQDFQYETEMPDSWQNAGETVLVKKGDCEDFAILAQEVLKKLGIKSDILVLKFQGLSQEHAVCMFKEGNYYSFISNQQLVRTSASTVTAAIAEQYSDWESITFTDKNKNNLQFVSRDNSASAVSAEFNTALAK